MDLKVKIKIKDVEIELDKKELKELKDILEDLFSEKKIGYVPYPYYPTYYPTYPYYRTYPYWEVTYGSITYSNKTTCGGDGNYTIKYNSSS